MSIILDALRRGRGTQTPRPNPNAAQTDAVLQTLGYGRLKPTTPVNRLKRMLAYLALAVVLAVALWAAVVWLTHAYLSPAIAPEGAAVRPAEPIAVSVEKTADKPNVTSVPKFVPPPATPPAAAPPPRPERPAEPSAPSAPVAGNGSVALDAPNAANRLVVQNSQRVNVSDSAPAVPTGTPTAATVTTGEDHFGRGMMYQRLGDFENALVSYRQVLQRDDLNVEAHNNLGVLYRDKGLFDDAIRHLQRAIAINPGYARARNNLGVVYLTQRKLDMSAAQFHAALAIDPRNVESMVNLSTIEKESGRRDGARGWLMRAIDIDPRNAEAHYNLGLLEDEDGNRTPAQSHYRAFLQYGAASHPILIGEVRKRIDALTGK